ncbi:XRE family transcriptional regulator [Clostridium tetani]|uniref:helix-turn-helix domain-containing protein n=1 Tax=Clostridium tetani TaxID=1513 RepID=UPI00100B1278|nr:helix-turn-helix transcriptional regulator [Clostridium tetani]RXM79263.1 XRE family transcriptional regulator [Clostridium tetani]RYV00075.1 XRE family transcriptional regulator [Clostridium tetani]
MKINLKKIREDRGLTQTQLAIMVSASQNYISEIESGKKLPSLMLLEKISNSLNVCVAFLIVDEKNNCQALSNCIRKIGGICNVENEKR